MGRARRLSMEGPRTGGMTYNEIREAYNIPSNNTLPAGVGTTNNNSGVEQDMRNNNNVHQNPHDRNNLVAVNIVAVNTGTGMPSRNTPGSNSTGNISRMARRKSFSEAAPPDMGYASDLSGNIQTTRNQRGPKPRQPQPQGHPRRSNTTSPSRPAFKRRSTVGGIPPPLNMMAGEFPGRATQGQGGHNKNSAAARKRPPPPKRRASISSNILAASDPTKRRDSQGSNGAASDPGFGPDFNTSDSSTEKPRLSGRGIKGLKSLPENASFRGSSHFNNVNDGPRKGANSVNLEDILGDDYFQQQKDLNSMTVGKLKTQLKQQGISVDGIYDKRVLIGMFSQTNPFDQLGDNQKKPHNDLNKSNDGPRRRRRASIDNGRGNIPSGPLRRKTIDQGNPQQGMSSLSGISFNAPTGQINSLPSNNNTSIPGQYNSFTAPTGQNISFTAPKRQANSFTSGRRPSSKSSISSMGDPDDGSALGLGFDAGMKTDLMQQMHQLEGQKSRNQQALAHESRPPGGAPRRMDALIVGNNEAGLIDARHPTAQRDFSGNDSPLFDPIGANDELPQVHSMKHSTAGDFHTTSTSPEPSRAVNNNGLASFSFRSTNPSPAAGDSLGGTMHANMFSDDCSENAHLKSLAKLSAKKKRKKKIRVVIPLILVLIVALALTYVFLFVLGGGDENENNENDTPLSRSNDVSPQTNSSVPSHIQYLEAPLPDTEGRCSPSNLPGSLSACRAACQPSACCYPTYSNDTCIGHGDIHNVDACHQYRPYCDVIYDSWPGAEDGVIRSPPESIATLCGTIAGVSSTVGETNDTYVPPNNESFERKRLRHGLARDDRDVPSRNLRTLPTHGTCDQLCKYARCCHTAVNVSGIALSTSGVYTNSTNNEHLVTNCKFGENEQLCREYAKFCHDSSSKNVDNGASINSTSPSHLTASLNPLEQSSVSMEISPSVPSAIPADTAFSMTFRGPTTSPTFSSSPTQTSKSSLPSNSSHPTAFNSSPLSAPSAHATSNIVSPVPTVPPASTLEIAAACSGDENEALISSGVSSARAKCISACQKGLCCYADMLGYIDWMAVCYDENVNTCLEYLPCLVLIESKEDPVATDDTDVIKNEPTITFTIEGNIGESNTAMNTNTADIIIESPPTPAQNLTQICSRDSILTVVGLGECLLVCKAASCCAAQEIGDVPSCYDEHPETCAMYEPCVDIEAVFQDKEKTKIEEDTPTLSLLAEEIVEEPPELPLPASSNLPTVCSYESLAISGEECYELCQPGTCCSDDSCLKEDGDASQETLDDLDGICEMYQPCYNLYLVSAPPSNFNATCDRSNNSNAGECTTICSAVSCCFSGSTLSASTSSTRQGSVVNPINTEICPKAYDPSIASSYEEGSEVEDNGVMYRCNGDPWAFYCTQSNFRPNGSNDLWVNAWSEVGPCITLPDPTSNPINAPSTLYPTYSPVVESNVPSSSCYAHFEQTCNEFAPYCAPAHDIPPPPSSLATICSYSASVCIDACKAASCCFEPSSELNCFDDNKERCEEYSPCNEG